MATGTDKFLNYNGLVKLIGLIKKRINDAVDSIDLSWKTNKFVKSIAGYGTDAAPASTSGVNDTKNKLEGTYTTGNLDGTGTDVSTNKFTYIDTTYGAASTSKAGLMSSADKTKLDNLGATGASKGANLVKYDGTAATTTGSVAEAIKNLQGAVGGGDLVKSVDDATQESVTLRDVNIVLNHKRTGNYTKADGTTGTYQYYDTRYDNAVAESNSGGTTTPGQAGLMSGADKTKLDGIATGAQVNVIEHVRLAGESSDLTVTNKRVTIPTATTTVNGLMSSDDKTELDNMVADFGNKLNYVVFSENSSDLLDGSSISNEAYSQLVEVASNSGKVLIINDTVASVWDDGEAMNVVILGPGDEGVVQWSKVSKTQNGTGGLHDVTYYDTIDINAEPNIIDTIKVNNNILTPSNKEVNITAVTGIKNNGDSTNKTGNVIVAKVNGKSLVGATTNVELKSGDINLTNNITVDGTSKGNVQDALTALNTLAAANKSAISTLQSGGLTREIVTTLPTGSAINTNAIYMILASNDTLNSGDPSTSANTTPYGTNNNSYNEYMYINNTWERIGSTEVNLDIDPITNDEIDTAWSTTVAAA